LISRFLYVSNFIKKKKEKKKKTLKMATSSKNFFEASNTETDKLESRIKELEKDYAELEKRHKALIVALKEIQDRRERKKLIADLGYDPYEEDEEVHELNMWTSLTEGYNNI
jgi:predicted transcriptional regulator